MSAVSNTDTSTLSFSNGLNVILPPHNKTDDWSNSSSLINDISTESTAIESTAIRAAPINKRDSGQTKTNGDNQVISTPNTAKSIYLKPLERENYLENSPIKQETTAAITAQKQQNENNSNFLANAFSYIKNLFSGKATKNDDTLKINKALAVLTNDAVSNEKAAHALNYLTEQAVSCKSPLSFSSKDARIDNFSVNLIKDITATDYLLKLRKRALHLTDLPNPENINKTDRALFINSLVKNIENRINQHLSNYVRTKYKSTSISGKPEQTQKTYAEMLSYIKSIKSEMRPDTQPLTKEEEEKENISFLANTLGNICVNNNFNAKAMPEIQFFPEPLRLQFIQSIHGKIDKKIQSLRFDIILNPEISASDYEKSIKSLEETKAKIR